MIVIRSAALGQIERIPSGELGTRVTLAKMRTLARAGAKDPMVKQTAEQIVRDAGVAPGSLDALRALFTWVRDRISYKADPRGFEMLSEPRRTLEKRHEDCDGKATLLAALALAIKHPARIAFRAIATRAAAPGNFSHVYTVARVGKQVIAIDATYPNTAFGWQYQHPASVLDCAV